MITTASYHPCGCTGATPPRPFPWARSACDCGCGGCTGCDTASGACTSGTEEATKRPGIVAASCLPPRPRFFPGQLVTDVDLRAMVDHARAQQLLAGAVASGWGVYSGFALAPDPDACSIVVGPGVALDAQGRALVHGGDTRIGRPERAMRAKERRPIDPSHLAPPEETLVLAAVYDDHLDVPRPRFGAGCGGGADPGGDYSRVAERVRFVWLPALPDAYWTSGCLPDPCDDTPHPVDARCGYIPAKRSEPMLDACTPPIGARGGAGVQEYADRLAHRWNLPRNAALLGAAPAATPGPPEAAVGAILDVISGVACERCAGEAIVALGEVKFSNADGKPALELRPLRRRVLSNADLTYLIAWTLDRVLHGAPAGVPSEREPALPTASAPCTAPSPPSGVGQGSAGPASPELEALQMRVAELEARLKAGSAATSEADAARPPSRPRPARPATRRRS